MRRLVFAIVLLLGCGQGFTPSSLIAELRLLGVRAESPDLRPGESTLLTTLATDPDGREISILWARCDIPGVVTDLLLCQNQENLTPLGAGSSITVTAPGDYLDTGPNAPMDRRFLYVVLLVEAGEDQIFAFKEILVTRENQPLNRNPELTGIRIFPPDNPDLELTSVTPAQVVRLEALYSPESREEYLDQETMKTEDMIVSWFADFGDMERNKTTNEQTNAWQAPNQPGTVNFWVVLRDGRNGTDWRTFTLEVR